MQTEIIQNIIKEKKTCYFVSPHFDDAAFSAGALISYLAGHTKVVIINVFTKADSLSTFSAKTYLKQCGYTDAKKLYEDRENEDAAVFKHIGNKVINLGFTDALWRKKYTHNVLSRFFANVPELQVIYPTYKFHIIKGTIAKQDIKTLEQIKEKLQKIIDIQNSVLFCPFGTGNHIDHVITRKACDDLYSSLMYWSDFPYNLTSGQKENGYSSFFFEENLTDKEELIKGYKTQYAAMFADGLHLKPEQFFIKK